MNRNKTIRATPIGRGAPDLPDRGPTWMTDERRGCAPGKPVPGKPDRDIAELFYSRSSADQKLAVRICEQHCPFRVICDRYASEQGEAHGVWGGRVRDSKTTRREVSVSVLIDWALTSRPEIFRDLDDEQRAMAIREGIARGMSFNQMAGRFRRSIRWLKVLSGEPIESLDEQVKRMYEAGRPDITIAAALGTHPSTIAVSRARQGLVALYGPGGRPRKQQAVA